MSLDPRLEHYLSSLDRSLNAIPVSDRADIVTEIKSHVLSALEREPKASLDSVLSALGEPEIVANHYLLERGLKPGKPPVSPVVKWIVIGFLGTGALMVVFFGLLLHAVGPVVKISDKDERVTLLGGLIDIDGKAGTVKIGDSFIDGGGPREKFQGSAAVKTGDKLFVKFANGSVTASTGTDSQITWSCSGRQEKGLPPAVAEKDNEKTLDLSSLDHLRCSLTFPKGAAAHVEGRNGKISLEKPEFDLDAELDNGKAFVEKGGAKYAFDFSVRNGKVSAPASDPNPDYRLHIQVGNGKISVEGND